MFTLTKKDRDAITAEFTRLQTKRDAIEDALRFYNEMIIGAHRHLTSAIKDYNAQAEVVRGKLDDERAAFMDQFSTRGEAWQRSDVGDTVAAWIGEFEEVGVQVIDATVPDVPATDIEALFDTEPVGETDPATMFASLSDMPT